MNGEDANFHPDILLMKIDFNNYQLMYAIVLFQKCITSILAITKGAKIANNYQIHKLHSATLNTLNICESIIQ